MSKERLDILLVKRNLVDSREQAKRLVMAGLVFSETERLDKPGMKIDINRPLTVKEQLRYVGRGGLKLEKALEQFDVSVQNKIAVDIGASTGGFTDCALQNGASLVYAIDVGYNQLAWKLRSDERVVVMEKTNFRYVTSDMLQKGLPQFAMIDVSFISLRLILPVLATILDENSTIITLIKPQFEAGKDEVGKRGVVRDQAIHRAVLQNIISFAENEQFSFEDLTFSPITGGKGNIEYLAHFGWKLTDTTEKSVSIDKKINATIERAHTNLAKS